jgi:hypothetical protein
MFKQAAIEARARAMHAAARVTRAALAALVTRMGSKEGAWVGPARQTVPAP